MPTTEESLTFQSDFREVDTSTAYIDENITEKVLDDNWVKKRITALPFEKKVNFKKYRFHSFYHAHIGAMIAQLNRYGIDGLLNPKTDTENGLLLKRQLAEGADFDFEAIYSPLAEIVEKETKIMADSEVVVNHYPKEDFDFNPDSPYGSYNWEVFFHGPMLIAGKLSQNQKFEEAQKWYHFIFDPTETDGPAPQRYWRIKPFYQQHDTYDINEILIKMASGNQAFNRQLNQWMKNPFKPHAVARIRTVAYMKNVVMKYLDNLIAWGDHLFRKDTIESINEATQLYILASQILGPKPKEVTKPEPTPMKVGDIFSEETPFENPLVAVEGEMGDVSTGDEEVIGDGINNLRTMLYFCTSPNDKLNGYWGTVADRLYKIRNCQNIEGVKRSLALFEPPIDPALLVKAAAAGLDIGTVLNGISGVSRPHYRFRSLIQKAIELCNEVKSLGQNLLSVLEKKDAEELALLRSNQEVALLKAIREVKKQSIEENTETLASLTNSKELAEMRFQYYDTREYMNSHEKEQLKKMDKALKLQLKSQGSALLASALALIVDVEVGSAGISSPFATGKKGGGALYNSLNGASQALQALSAIENVGASKAGIKGSYDRRRDDWKLQASMAEKEIEQVEKQIVAAEIRLAVSERDLVNHDMQIAQSQEVQEFMKNKFTNRDLYNWMITQTSGIYFQSYQLAYDVARMAEQSFGYELAKDNVNFIQFGHWDSLKKGLLSGDKLMADLRRMEVSYMEQNKREYEITKHVPLSLLSPAQLIDLRENGICDFFVPEVLFDMDYPGQYMRRIKSVRVTIPGVTGPYTNVNAKLTLLSNRTRKSSDSSAYAYAGTEDPNFDQNVGNIQSIATSSGQNDSGTFELNFQDERYLPFEGAGAISSWRLELPASSDFRSFDYDTISDVILHLSYTAREGGEALKSAANGNIQNGLDSYADWLAADPETQMQKVISLKTHFPNALYEIKSSSNTTEQEATIELKKEHFPYFLKDKTINTVDQTMVVMIKMVDGESVIATHIRLYKGANHIWTGTDPDDQPAVASGNGLPLPYASFTTSSGSAIDDWRIVLVGTDSSDVEDIYLVVNYTVS